MSNELTNPVTGKAKKKPIFKRWWFWILSILAFIIIVSALSSGGSTVYELSKATTMSKKEIVEKFGKPDEVVRDDKDGYSYGYNTGFLVSGNEKGATQIQLASAMIKKKSSDSYKVLDAALGSSFDENIKRLGKPNLSITKDGKKNAAYLTKEGFIFTLSTESSSDKIAAIELSAYDESTIASSLDISKLLGSLATEEEIKKVYEIKDKSSDQKTTTYGVEGFHLIVDNQDHTVKMLVLSSDSIYNIHGIRVGDSIDKANKVFGNPVNSMEGVKNTTQYTYKYEDTGSSRKVTLSIDNSSKKIGYIEVSAE